jgi:hypothetical protein
VAVGDVSDQIEITISTFEEFDVAFGSVGLGGWSRTGPNRRTHDDKEWYVVRGFLRAAIPKEIFVPPISVRKGCPPDQDFLIIDADAKEIVGSSEITEATDEADQREMTEIELSGQPALLGTHGGRVAANPERLWAKDVIDAILRKKEKAIFLRSLPSRHLIIYPNSNISALLFDDEAERKAISVLSTAISDKAKHLAQIANGCHVHVLGKENVCINILGGMRLVKRDNLVQGA